MKQRYKNPSALDPNDLTDLAVRLAQVRMQLDPNAVSSHVEDRTKADTYIPPEWLKPEFRYKPAFHFPETATYPSLNVPDPGPSEQELLNTLNSLNRPNTPDDDVFAAEIQKSLNMEKGNGS